MDNNKQTILIVHNFYQQLGGEDGYIKKEKRLLEENGHKVFLYTRHNDELKKFSFLLKVLLPFTAIFSTRTYREVIALIKKEKIDVVHVHNTLSLISPSVYYAAIKCGVPVVQTIHNFRLLCPGATFTRDERLCKLCTHKGLGNAIKYRCYRKSLAQTLECVLILKIHRLLGIYTKINYICLTEFNRHELLELNANGRKVIDPDKVYVKSIFADIERVPVEFSKRKKQVIFIGRQERVKGIFVLLGAWKQIKDYDLLLCGSGPESDNVKKYIADNKMSNVKALGFIDDKFKIEAISKAFAVVMPSLWYEGFPMVILESYSCGTPILGSNIGNINALVLEDKSGVTYQFDDPNSLVSALKELESITNDEFCNNIYQTFREKYISAINYRQLKRIYDVVK